MCKSQKELTHRLHILPLIHERQLDRANKKPTDFNSLVRKIKVILKEKPFKL